MRYFTIEEFCKSETAVLQKINNTPSEFAKNNIEHLIVNLLDPLRERYGKPLTVNSGYRCKELNSAVGGVTTSQHTKGEAADLSCADPKLLLTHLKNSRLTFDQAILYPTFLHVSLKRTGENRGQFLTHK